VPECTGCGQRLGGVKYFVLPSARRVVGLCKVHTRRARQGHLGALAHLGKLLQGNLARRYAEALEDTLATTDALLGDSNG
jgi:hypothetical protein